MTAFPLNQIRPKVFFSCLAFLAPFLAPSPMSSSASQPILETITLGAGCFWCVEAVYESIPGVVEGVSGYTGGHIKNPAYREVCAGSTGHAEVVQVTFDSSVLSLADLLDVFFCNP